MKNFVEKMLDSYEKGKIGRREFIQCLAVITASPGLLTQPAQTVFQGRTLNHVTLAVANVDRSRDFYQKLLGLRVINEEKDYCSLDLGQSFLAMYKDQPAARVDHFCIGVDSFNANAVLAKLKKEMPSSNPTLENDTEVYLFDPDNIRFQLGAIDYKH